MALFGLLMKKMNDVGYSIETFWKVGTGCFAVIALMTLIGLIQKWSSILWYTKVSLTATFIFQCALAYLFYWLLKSNNQKTEAVAEVKEIMKDKDMLKLLQVQSDINEKEVKEHGKKTRKGI